MGSTSRTGSGLNARGGGRPGHIPPANLDTSKISYSRHLRRYLTIFFVVNLTSQ